MAQKVNPTSLRLGITIPWSSRWFFKRSLRYFLEEDHCIRKVVRKRVLAAGIAAIHVERTRNVVKIIVRASRPGLIIGRGGKGIDDLRLDLLKSITALRKKNKVSDQFSVSVNIEELKRNDISAPVVAQQIAFDIEKRKPFRMIMRRAIEEAMQNRDIRGAKIKLSGRLNGAEIARQETLSRGQMPLQTLRGDIDYGEATAFNSYGTIGIKVWFYKGEIFEKKS